MDSRLWRRVSDIFIAAVDLEAPDRSAYLDAACGNDDELRDEVDSLLGASGSGERVEQLVGTWLTSSGVGPSPRSPVGQRVGPYVVREELGGGGMADVFLAEREDGQFARRVALKILRYGRRSGELERRFLHERQILARLVHHGIARLYDGGFTDAGLPYIVMEYVDGQPLDRYCDERRLTVSSRLVLFEEVCTAVRHAHRNLVVHRDLKPSNILVTAAGEVKLLDFGIAKLLADEEDRGLTHTNQQIMTPDYASPEQVVGGSVTTATDVYALGVILYELLAGRRPYTTRELTPTVIERVICTEVPRPPSRMLNDLDEESAATVCHDRGTTRRALRRILSADLDTIVLQALHKDPERRYASAAELREDLRRCRQGRPVQARPDTFGYRSAKFLRRNRLGVAAAAAVLLSLVSGVVATSWQASRARAQSRIAAEQRDRARAAAQQSEHVTAFLIDLFEGSDPNSRTGALTARQILDRGIERVERDLSDEPAIQGELMLIMAQVSLNLGEYDRAEELLDGALARARAAHGERSEPVAEALNEVARLAQAREQVARSDSLLRIVLDRRRALHGPDDPLVAETAHNLGVSLMAAGRFDSAEVYLERALTIRRGSPDVPLSTLGVNVSNLAVAASRLGDRARAEKLHLEALEMQREDLGSVHPEVATTLNNVALLRYRRGDLAGAAQYMDEALAVWRATLPEDHPQIARGLNNLAAIHEKRGDLAGAEPLYREALRRKRLQLGPDHPTVARSLNNLGLLLQRRGQLDEAEGLLRESLRVRRQAFGERHADVARAQHNLAALLVELGDRPAADTLFRAALATRRELLGVDDDQTRETAAALASIGAE